MSARKTMAERFTTALQTAEESGDAGSLVALFAADAELSNLAKPEPVRGPDAAGRFWADYLKSFAKVRSEFSKTVAADDTVVLEWESDGELPNGKPIRYRGVSVLDLNGERVAKFRTYYDTAAFVAPAAGAGA